MTLKNILKTTLIFLMFLTLVSCKSNNYRTFDFYTIEVLNSDSAPSSLIEEYKNTSIDLYENKLIYSLLMRVLLIYVMVNVVLGHLQI